MSADREKLASVRVEVDRLLDQSRRGSEDVDALDVLRVLSALLAVLEEEA